MVLGGARVTCISSANHPVNRLDDVLSRARARCGLDNITKNSPSATSSCSGQLGETQKLSSVFDCIERCLGYGIEAPVFQGQARPPLVTYTVTATEGGSVHRATNEYVLWYRTTFGFDKTPDRGCPRPTRRSDQDVGGPPEF